MSVPTYWLSFHVPYACRQSGACCSSGWDIAVERARVSAIDAAIAAGRMAAPALWYRRVPGAPDEVAGVLTAGADGGCIFHQSPGCAIHSALGREAMPSACQHFPRIVLIDPRGIFVTLSHYCPTAAAQLFDTAAVASIVQGPPALPGGRLPEGLDARDALPPLASPTRLMDWDAYSAWERRAVAVLTRATHIERALETLDACTSGIADRVLFGIARQSVPSPHRWPAFVTTAEDVAPSSAPIVGRYLAAHAFAAWTAYEGDGIQSTVLYLRIVLAVLKGELARGRPLLEAIRQSDLLLRHLADRDAFARGLSAIAAR